MDPLSSECSLFGKENYVNGRREGVSEGYYESGQMSESATYRRGKIVEQIQYDEAGNRLETVVPNSYAKMIEGGGNIGQFFVQNSQYPEELQLQGRRGIVMMHFTVKKDGQVADVEVIHSSDPLFEAEALRVFGLIEQMKPGFAHGQTLEHDYIFPVTFQLSSY